MIACLSVCLELGNLRLEGIDFQVAEGAYTCLSGRSGAGKTSIMEAICGLRAIQSGRILIGGKDQTYAPPEDRQIGYVPQDGALFRSLTVRRHLSLGLELRHWSKQQREERVQALAVQTGLTDLLERRPSQLSGGEQQRVALARALSFGPQALCLDEPFSALDPAARKDMQHLLVRLQHVYACSILHITHYPEEAAPYADQMLSLADGKLHAV